MGSANAASGGPLLAFRGGLYEFEASPFPYRGLKPDDGTPFMDVQTGNGRLGHSSPRGGVYYEDQTYSDRHVIVALPGGFDLRKRAAIVVFFHGNNAVLNRDVNQRQRVVDQLQDSGINAAFIAPQFAVDALDSSAGHFWDPGFFAKFMAEAASHLATLWGSSKARNAFASLPIILVAYSGGYNPAAYVLKQGGAGKRIRGVILLDALIAQDDLFADWIAASRRTAFFFSGFTDAAAGGNAALMQRLSGAGIKYSTNLPQQLVAGEVNFIATADADHDGYMTEAWTDNPLTWLLNRVPGYPRG
jgi:hypothetical protein